MKLSAIFTLIPNCSMAESNNDYLSRAMGQFKSAKVQKILTPEEAKRNQEEWDEQLRFSKRLHKEYPEILFYNDRQSSGKVPVHLRDIYGILNPFRSWPDTKIFLKRGKYCGLMIEIKRLNSGTFLKDGSLSTGQHVQEQHAMHELLRAQGWACCFAEGADKAWEMLERYLKI